MLDEYATRSLFPNGSAVGKAVEIMNEPFIVVGTVKNADEFKPVIENISDYYMYYSDTDGMLVVPDEVWPIIFGFDEPSNVSVMAESTEKMSVIVKNVEDIMNELIISANNVQEEDGIYGGQVSYKAANLNPIDALRYE